jgi:preprotein translocase subunit SecF
MACATTSSRRSAPSGRARDARRARVFDVIGKRRWFYIFSLIITIPGLVFILLTPFTDAGLQFTIDYTGGTRWEIKFEDPQVTPEQVRDVFAAEGLEASTLSTGSGFIEIKTEQIVGLQETPAASAAPSSSPGASASGSAAPSGSPDPSASPGASPSASPPVATGNTEIPTEGELGEVARALEEALGPIAEQRSLTTIGAVVSSDLISQAIILIFVGSIGIVLWITYRFRDVKFGITALASLAHDVVVVVGIFAILGTFFNVEIDALFVTAMLTVIGFSVHDTIVVFDRVRENKARHAGEPIDAIVNHSILQTFGRSIMTSLTVVLTLLALYLFGGSAISDFILALLIGIVSGTYSSIFVASPLLVDWQLWDDRRHGRLVATRAPRVRRSVS